MFPPLFDLQWEINSRGNSAQDTILSIVNSIVMVLTPAPQSLKPVKEAQASFSAEYHYDIGSNSVKMLHLQYLQENCSLLFRNNVPLFYDLYDKLMNIVVSLEPLNAFIDGHILTTICAVIIELDIMQKNPSLFQSFISHLLTVISSREKNRLLRQLCCECLYELESMYPALLSGYVFHILRLCQIESSHILESYTTLLMIVLEHWTQKILIHYNQQQQQWERSSTGSTVSSRMSLSVQNTNTLNANIITMIKAMENTEIKFVIPNYLISSNMPSLSHNITIPYILPEYKKEIHQCLSFVVENCSQFTVWGEVAILEHIFTFIDYTEFPVHILRNCLRGEIFGMNPLQWHYYYKVHNRFSSNNSSDLNINEELLLLKKLTHMLRDYSIPSHFRVLTAEWLISLSKSVHGPNATFFQQNYRQYFPMSFDDLILKEAKLKCIITFLNPFTIDSSRSNNNNNNQGVMNATDNLLDVLVCLNDYLYFKEFRGQNRRVDIIFDFLFRLLQKQPLYHEKIYKYMLKMINQEVEAHKNNTKNRSFIMENVIQFIDKYEEYAKSTVDPEQYLAIAKYFLSSLESQLCSLPTHIQYINHYFPLIQRIAGDPFMEPHNLLNYLYRYLNQKHVCEEGNWFVGDEILKTCRLAMTNMNLRNKNISIEVACAPLINILHLLRSSFDNITIKDQSNLYYKLFTNLRGEKLAFILQDVLSVDNNERTAQYKDTIKMLRTRMSSKSDPAYVHKVQPFLYLERIKKVNNRWIETKNQHKKQHDYTKEQLSNEEVEDVVKTYYIHLRKINKYLKMATNESSNDEQIILEPINRQVLESSTMVQLQYKLRYASREEIKKHILDKQQDVNSIEQFDYSVSASTKIYGLKLDFTSTYTKHFANLNSIQVPFLNPMAQNSNDLQNEYNFNLSFYPLRPIPGMFNVSAQFTASNIGTDESPRNPIPNSKSDIQSGVFCSTELNSITISLVDLFMQLPIPAVLRQRYPNQCLEELLFDLMWSKKTNSIISETRQKKEPNASAKKSTKRLPKQKNFSIADWTESIKVIEGDWDIRKHYPEIASFAVPSRQDQFIIFLPPKYHLLFSFKRMIASKDQKTIFTQINIRTDYSLVLSFVDSLFEPIH